MQAFNKHCEDSAYCCWLAHLLKGASYASWTLTPKDVKRTQSFWGIENVNSIRMPLLDVNSRDWSVHSCIAYTHGSRGKVNRGNVARLTSTVQFIL